MCWMFLCLLSSKLNFLWCWTYIVDYSGYTGHPQHYNYWQVEQIATIILLQCNSLLGNFGTSILVGVTLTCTTHLNIIADQVCPLKGTWQRDFTSLVPWIIWISEPCGVRVNFFHFSLSFSADSTHLRYIFQLLVCCLFLNMIKCTRPSLQSPQIPIQFSIQSDAWTTAKPLEAQRIHSMPCRGHRLGSSVHILTDQHSVTYLAEWCVSGGSDQGCWVLSIVSIDNE